MRKMMTDQQYQQLVARSSGPNVSSQLLLAQSQPLNAQYLSRKHYGDRAVVADQYYGANSSLASPNAMYPAQIAGNRSDTYLPSDAKDIRAQLAAGADRRGFLPAAALIEYPSPAYVDHLNSRALSATPISSDVAAYPCRYPSPQRGLQHGANASVANQSELLARARRTEIPSAYAGSYANGVRRLPPSALDDQAAVNVQAGILGSGASRGRDLERYLLAVQPEKLIRYAASSLAPEPALVQNRLTILGSNATSEVDMYSNYRKAKARRIGAYEYRGSPPELRREREREPYGARERYRERRRGETSTDRNRGKQSPPRRSKHGSVTTKDEVADHAGRGGNSSQSLEGRGHRNEGKTKRSQPSETAERARERPQIPPEAREKEENDHESDKDSELGSLSADLSDSEEEKVKKKSEETATVIDGPLAGMIFGCSSATFHECMRLQLFGLPAKNKDDVMRVTPGTRVFLFNFDTKEMSGIFEAVSHGGWQIQPDAFRSFGSFPSQVQVCCSEQCPNLSLMEFKPTIQDNYVNQHKFRFDLNSKQVKDLVRLFRQAARARPYQLDKMADHYLNARLQSEAYSMRGVQQQRPYSREHQARFGSSSVSYARVISMSAKTNIHESKRASKRAQKRRKKKKVFNRPESPKADNCSFNSLSGEIQAGDVAINASKCCGCDDTSNKNHAVIVRECIETGNHRNFEQHKEIVETLGNSAAKSMDLSGPHQGLSLSRPGEFPEPQSDLGKQVSFVEDSYNDGQFRLAGGRAAEQGQGLDVPRGTSSSCGNVNVSSNFTPLSTMGAGLRGEVEIVSSTTTTAEHFLNLGGDKFQLLGSGTGDVHGCSELAEKGNGEGLGHTGISKHGNDKCVVDTSECIIMDIDVRYALLDGGMDESLMETDLLHLDEGKDLMIMTELTTDSEAPCVQKDDEEMITAGQTLPMSGEEEEVVDFLNDEVVPAPVLVESELPTSRLDEEAVEVLDDQGEDDEAIIGADGVDSELLPSMGEEEAVEVLDHHDNDDEAVIGADSVGSALPRSMVEEEAVEVLDDHGEDDKAIIAAGVVESEISTSRVEEEAVEVVDDHGEDDEAIIAADLVESEIPTSRVEEEAVEVVDDHGEDDEAVIAADGVEHELPTSRVEEEAVELLGDLGEDDEAIIAAHGVDSELPSSKVEEEAVKGLDDNSDGDEAIITAHGVESELPTLRVEEDPVEVLDEL